MAKKILDDIDGSMLSPLIDVIFNALAAMFVIFIVYTLFSRPSQEDPIDLLAIDPIEGNFNHAIHFNLPTIGGREGKRFRIIDGRLPNDLHLDSLRGMIFGTPHIESNQILKEKATYDFRILAKDSTSFDTQDYRLVLHPGYFPLPLSSANIDFLRKSAKLPMAEVGKSFEAVLGGKGGFGRYKWELVQGTLPPGITLQNGILHGMPQKKGRYQFEVALEDDLRYLLDNNGQKWSWNSKQITRQFEVSVIESSPPLSAILNFGEARVGKPFFGHLSINTGYYDKIISPDPALPDNIRLSSATGSLSGVPSTPGSINLAFNVISPLGDSVQISEIFNVLPPKPNPTTPSLNLCLVVDKNITIPLPYRGMEEPVKWELAVGSNLPEGLNLEIDRIAGTPQKEENTTVLFKATDVTGRSYDQQVILSVTKKYDRKPLVIGTTAIPLCHIGKSYNFKLSANGGTGDYTWNAEGKLPGGLQFIDGGFIGTPSEAGDFPVEVRLTDLGIGEEKIKKLIIQVEPISTLPLEILSKKIPPVIPAHDYVFLFSACGGTGNYQWKFSGTLPAGLNFTETGIEGMIDTSLTNDNFPISVLLEDDRNESVGPQTFLLTIIKETQLSVNSTPIPILPKKNIFKKTNMLFGRKWVSILCCVVLMSIFFRLAYLSDEDYWEWEPTWFFIILGILIFGFMIGLFLN